MYGGGKRNFKWKNISKTYIEIVVAMIKVKQNNLYVNQALRDRGGYGESAWFFNILVYPSMCKTERVGTDPN